MKKTELEEKYFALLKRMATAPLRDLYLLEAESELLWAEILKERKAAAENENKHKGA